MTNKTNNTNGKCRYSRVDTLLAIPVFNEYEHITDILSAAHQYTNNILVVNDGSDDGTSMLLKNYDSIFLISHQKNEGYGQSLIDAFNFARTNGFNWIITMDCDHQHQPSWLPRFYAEIEKNDADIISGSRYIRTINLSSTKVPKERFEINKKITSLLNEKLRINLTDSFCGFKAYKVDSLNRLNLTEKGYAMPLQLWVQAVIAGLKISEIPVPLIYHDPKRHFSGKLENPEFRLAYYINVISQELKLYDYKIATENYCS